MKRSHNIIRHFTHSGSIYLMAKYAQQYKIIYQLYLLSKGLKNICTYKEYNVEDEEDKFGTFLWAAHLEVCSATSLQNKQPHCVDILKQNTRKCHDKSQQGNQRWQIPRPAPCECLATFTPLKSKQKRYFFRDVISLLARVFIVLIDTATQEVPMKNIWKKLSAQFLRYAIELLHVKRRTRHKWR